MSRAVTTRPGAKGRQKAQGRRSTAGRDVAILGAVAAVLLLFYLGLYVQKGYRFPIGYDTPVYTWWARYGGEVGLGAPGIGPRPGILGALASMTAVTGLPWGAVTGSLAGVLSLTLGLAAAGFVRSTLGPGTGLMGLSALSVGVYVAPLANGYFSTVFFGTCFLAAMAATALDLERPQAGALLGATVVLAGGGLAHPVFLGFGALVVLSGAAALIPASRRVRAEGNSWLATPTGRAVLPLGGAAVLTAGGLGLAGVGIGGGFDTSRDSALRRAGLARVVRRNFRSGLYDYLPRFTGLALAATLVAGPAVAAGGKHPRSRPAVTFFWATMAAWFVLTLAGIALLLLRFNVPGHRMVLFCLPVPIFLAIGLSVLLRSDVAAYRASKRRDVPVVAPMLVHGLAVLLVVASGWYVWRGQVPSVEDAEAAQVQAAADYLAAQPAGTPLIHVTNTAGGLPLTRQANLLRAAVPAERTADVYSFPGRPEDLMAGRPTYTGLLEHDALVARYWPQVRSVLDRKPVAVAIRSFDRQSYDRVSAMPGARSVADGVVALPGLGGPNGDASRVRSDESGLAPVSPWLTVVAGPLLLLLIVAVGLPWVVSALPRSALDLRLALAPAAGLAVLALSSVVVDAAGLRLSAPGGYVAVAAPFVLGVPFSLWRSRPSSGA